MIRIEPIETLPALEYTEYAQMELELFGGKVEDRVRKSDFAYCISNERGPGVVLGLQRYSLTSIPYLWFLLVRPLNAGELRLAKRVRNELLSGVPRFETWVEKDFRVGHRFARFFDLHPLEREVKFMDREFLVYEGVG